MLEQKGEQSCQRVSLLENITDAGRSVLGRLVGAPIDFSLLHLKWLAC